MSAPDVWSRDEVEVLVTDYLHMLAQELAGQKYNKTTHRRALASKLSSRTDGSIERKHQNVSAVLLELGCPYISGYKPLANYQGLLFEVVVERVDADVLLDRTATSAAEQPAVVPLAPDFNRLLEQPPPLRTAEPSARYLAQKAGIRRDYLDREARNRSLGAAGEAFVVTYERFRLRTAGQSRLSDRVEHVSQTKGDGLGYDVLSFEASGRERFIEVKTTAFGKETPFFISRGEVAFSAEATVVDDNYFCR